MVEDGGVVDLWSLSIHVTHVEEYERKNALYTVRADSICKTQQ